MLRRKGVEMEQKGVIYTNPSFPQYVKIGYVYAVDKRLYCFE